MEPCFALSGPLKLPLNLKLLPCFLFFPPPTIIVASLAQFSCSNTITTTRNLTLIALMTDPPEHLAVAKHVRNLQFFRPKIDHPLHFRNELAVFPRSSTSRRCATCGEPLRVTSPHPPNCRLNSTGQLCVERAVVGSCSWSGSLDVVLRGFLRS